MIAAALLAVAAWNRWLLTFSVSAVLVLVLGAYARQLARRTPKPAERTSRFEFRHGGVRRRAGGLIALGPLLGLAFAPALGKEAILVGVGTAVLAVFGMVIERSDHVSGLALIGVTVAALAAVLTGLELGPTGVPALDVIGGFLFVFAVTKSIDGLGNVDGLVAEAGGAAALALFAIAGFAGQVGLATVFVGLTATCLAFLAFNLRPASLFMGRGGRLAVGFALSTGALAVHPVPTDGRTLVVPMILLALFWFDASIVVLDRARRRHRFAVHRSDHLVHRLAALGWTPREAVSALVCAQVVLGVVALFTARAVMPVWLGAGITAVVLLVLGIEVARARIERDRPVGLHRWVKVGLGLVVVALLASMLPLALAAQDSVDLMKSGRDAAKQGLNAARDGDATTARAEFTAAAGSFSAARDKLESPTLAGGLAVPFLASNVRAARTLSEIGTDLAESGASITNAVNPDALQVIDGRLPLEEVAKVKPELQHGSEVLDDALRRLDDLRTDPYLLGPVRDAIDKVHTQLAQATGEARRASAAAQLAPAIFGGEGTRRYLLVVQNNAESRATGGFIGNFWIITATNGKLEVSHLLRTRDWNDPIRAAGGTALKAPQDYLNRYGQFRPNDTMQNVNMSPDFPSVAQVLTNLAPAAGYGNFDGVMGVDPQGLSALLELTGPVKVEQWPDEINSQNVVDVTLRDAYAAYADQSPERADFLGDVAQAAVDKATSGTLGKPAQIAKVLGKAAHEGHLTLAFTRPAEQALAEQLGIAQNMAPVHSDAIAVTSSNSVGNKIDFYLKRTVDYRVTITPDNAGNKAQAAGELSVTMDNTAPNTGLPQYVIGPYDARFVAGQNRSFVSLYSPLEFTSASVDGQATAVAPGRERGRNVYSLFTSELSKQQKTVAVKLAGTVKMHDGWYDVVVRNQPSIIPDTVRVSVDVPEGWRIDKAPGMERPFERRASINNRDFTKTTTYRVHVVRDPGTWDIWNRLEAGV